MKNKLRKLMALFVAGAFVGNAGAQETNIIANWDGGSNTGKPTEFGWESSYAQRSWGTLNGSGARVTNNYSGYTLEDGTTYSYVADSEPSSQILWIRYANTSETYTYTFKGLEAGHSYKFSGLVGWHNNSDYEPTFTITINGTSEFAKMTKTITKKQILYQTTANFTVPTNEEAENFTIKFTCNRSQDCMEALSALSITEDGETYKSKLSLLISQATSINTKVGGLDEAIATAQSCYENGTASELYDAITTLQSEIDEKWAAYELNPEGDDVTCLFINTGFDEDINFTASSEEATVPAKTYPTLGWTSTVDGNCTGATIGYDYTGTINGGNATVPTTNSDGTAEGGALFICVGWSGTVIYKSLPASLAAGSYTITYKAYNGNTRDTNALDIIPLIGFVPEEGDAIISNTTETFANQQWVEKNYTFTLNEATKGQIQIGMKPTTNTNSYYAPELFIDKITLTYYNPSIKELMDAVEEAKNATAANVGVNAFQHPQAAADILNSTREDAEDILANASDIATIENATKALNEAIEVFEAVELNAPKKETRYAIQTAANWVDFTRNNKNWDHLQDTYFTYLADDRGDHGHYNIKLGFGKKDYLAQAFVFEAVDDVANGYKLYQTDKDGNARYISTGVPYGGNVSQIRTTTEADKALVFQVVATETDGVYNLYNTDKGANLCPQDEGAYCSDDHPEMDALRFVAASKAEVTLKVTDLGWATLMLPFNAEIPVGLEVWSCTGEENGVLTLEAVGSIAANTPYVVSGEVGEYTFADYGLAKQDAYAGTMLTGTYAETEAPADSYVLQNGTNGFGFYKVTEGKQPKVGAYRCYITVPASSAAMFSFSRGGDDETTGIESSTLNVQPSTVIYDLQGRRVEKMEKGIYIVNGRKVVIR